MVAFVAGIGFFFSFLERRRFESQPCTVSDLVKSERGALDGRRRRGEGRKGVCADARRRDAGYRERGERRPTD